MGRCELTGKAPVVKNLVSHSNIKTKSVASPNIQTKRIFSRVLNQMVRLNLATSVIRDMEHVGGFDLFIVGQKSEKMSKKALAVRSRILAKMTGPKKAAVKQ
jgi:large subunit ribosomal protein L28